MIGNGYAQMSELSSARLCCDTVLSPGRTSSTDRYPTAEGGTITFFRAHTRSADGLE